MRVQSLVGKIPWKRKWQPTPRFLPEKSHGHRNVGGNSPWGHKESLLRVSSFGYKALVFIPFTICYFLVFLLYCFFFLLLLRDKCSLYFGYFINHFFPDYQFSSVQFSRSVVSDSLRPHQLQHTRPHCPSPTPGVYPNSCPLTR